MSASLSTPLSARGAAANYQRRRLVILTAVIVVCSIVTICFCTWVTVVVSRARSADASTPGTVTPASSVAPAQGSLCP